MKAFSNEDMDALDATWRQLPRDHAWTGWAHVASHADEVWLFRTRANWRRFILRKVDSGFMLEDDVGKSAGVVARLSDLPEAVARVPALKAAPN